MLVLAGHERFPQEQAILGRLEILSAQERIHLGPDLLEQPGRFCQPRCKGAGSGSSRPRASPFSSSPAGQHRWVLGNRDEQGTLEPKGHLLAQVDGLCHVLGKCPNVPLLLISNDPGPSGQRVRPPEPFLLD